MTTKILKKFNYVNLARQVQFGQQNVLTNLLTANTILCVKHIQKGVSNTFFSKDKISCLNWESNMVTPAIVLDIEMTSAQLFIGLYFVHIDTYCTILFDVSMEESLLQTLYEEWVCFKSQLDSACFVNKNSFKITKPKNEEKMSIVSSLDNIGFYKPDENSFLCQSLLLTYNGANFDVPMLSFFEFGFPNSIKTKGPSLLHKIFSKQKHK
jgi:hypothetical protein